jgi:hypothetical protein
MHRQAIHNLWKDRESHGLYHTLVQELMLYEEKFADFFRLSREQFAQVHYLVEPFLRKRTWGTKSNISPRERLCICIR